LGEVLFRIGDTPKTPAGELLLHLFISTCKAIDL